MPIPLSELLRKTGSKRVFTVEAGERGQVENLQVFMTPAGSQFIAVTYRDHLGYDLYSRIPDGREEQVTGLLESSPAREVEIVPLAPDVSGAAETYVGTGDNRRPEKFAVFLRRDGARKTKIAEPRTHATAHQIGEALAASCFVTVKDRTNPWHRYDARAEDGEAEQMARAG